MKSRASVTYATLTFGVEASSEEEAEEKAMDEAYNTSFDEDTADYEIDSCSESELTDASLNLPTKNGRMSMERNMNIIESWWRHNGIWDREQASGILVENYDGETEIYLASTDDWWDSLSDKQKQDVYEDFFNET